MAIPFAMVAFDADDTLWHNQHLYDDAQERFKLLLRHYHEPAWIEARLYETEVRNLAHFGYGIKAFALSMLETACELTEGRISGADVREIIALAKQMLAAPIELLPHVAEIIPWAAARFPLMIITKGDLLDQEQKIARSGLGKYFRHVAVISDKRIEDYRDLLARLAVEPARFLMIGNSLRSDILPVLALGGTAIYVPQDRAWAHEAAETPEQGSRGFYQVKDLSELPALFGKFAGG